MKRGDIISWDGYKDILVMAVADGYAMLRRKGCTPFVMYIKDIEIKKNDTTNNKK